MVLYHSLLLKLYMLLYSTTVAVDGNTWTGYHIEGRKPMPTLRGEFLVPPLYNLILARRIRGLSQRELARKVNTGYGNISRIENGEQVPKIDLMFKFRRVLGFSIDFLMDGWDPSEPADQDRLFRAKYGDLPGELPLEKTGEGH